MIEPPPDSGVQPMERTGTGDIKEARAVGTDLRTPFDATPSPDGTLVFFTGMTDMGGAIFKASAAGGDAAPIATGLIAPISLVLSTDGATVYVVDVAYGDATDRTKDEPGAIYKVASTGGTPELITNTVGYQPRGLDLVKQNGADVLFFSGTEKGAMGLPGVFKMLASGGEITTVAKGEPFVDPSGVAVTQAGDVYVADTKAGPSGRGAILKVAGASAVDFVSNCKVEQNEEFRACRLGYPAGIALSYDDKFLLVSAINTYDESALVYRIEIANKTITVINQGISDNSESGGVHRAHGADRFAWADSDAPDRAGRGGGRVYLLGTTASPIGSGQ